MTTNKNRTGVGSLCADGQNYLEKEEMKEQHQPFARWNALVEREKQRQATTRGKARDQADKSGGRHK